MTVTFRFKNALLFIQVFIRNLLIVRPPQYTFHVTLWKISPGFPAFQAGTRTTPVRAPPCLNSIDVTPLMILSFPPPSEHFSPLIIV